MEFDVSPVTIGMVVSFISFAVSASVVAYAVQQATTLDKRNDAYGGWVVMAIVAGSSTVAMFVVWCNFLHKLVHSYL